jgi:hypothetical protein
MTDLNKENRKTGRQEDRKTGKEFLSDPFLLSCLPY